MRSRDVTKLPQWAQQRIALLESAVAGAEAELVIGPEDSDTFADPHGPYIDGHATRPLGRGVRIRYVVDERLRRYFDVRLTEDGELEVMGDRRLRILCCSSNLFSVVMDDD